MSNIRGVTARAVYELGRAHDYLQRESAVAAGLLPSEVTYAIGDDVQASVSTDFEEELSRGFLDGIALSVEMDRRRAGS